MKTWHLGAVFAVGLVVFAVANLPLSAVLAWSGAQSMRLSYAQAEGTVWDGRLRDAVVGPMALGDVDLALQPLDLLRGRAAIRTRFAGGPVSGEGLVTADLSRTLRLKNARMAGDLAALPTVAPMTGAFAADIETLVISEAGCRAGTGTVAADPVIHDGAGKSWTSPPLSGTLTCADGVLSLPVRGEAGAERVAMDLALEPDRSYRIGLDIRTGNQGAVQAMTLLGFEEAGGSFRYQEKGRWRGLSRAR